MKPPAYYTREEGTRLEREIIELQQSLTAFERKWNNMWGTPEERHRRAKKAAEARWARLREQNGTD